MTFKELDFVKLEMDTFANGILVRTTDETKGKEAQLKIEKYAPETIIIGRNFVLENLEKDILKAKIGEERSIELSIEDAYGKKKKEMMRTFPKKVFDEKQLRAVVGMTYDFNGMFGTVKSVVGGRVMVDFNNPLAGKNIKFTYKVTEVIKDIKDKINFLFHTVLKLPANMVQVIVKDKNVALALPEQVLAMKEQFTKTIEESIPEIKDYKVSFGKLVVKKTTKKPTNK